MNKPQRPGHDCLRLLRAGRRRRHTTPGSHCWVLGHRAGSRARCRGHGTRAHRLLADYPLAHTAIHRTWRRVMNVTMVWASTEPVWGVAHPQSSMRWQSSMRLPPHLTYSRPVRSALTGAFRRVLTEHRLDGTEA